MTIARQLEPLEGRAARSLGTAFLAYVSASAPTDIESRIGGAASLSERQEASFLAAVNFAVRASVTALQHGGTTGDWLYELFAYDADAATTHPNLLRRAAGGRLPSVRATNPTEHALATLARDVFPSLLVDVEPSHPGIPAWVDRGRYLTHTVFRHPCSEAFESGVLSDRDLSRLFPSEVEGSGRIGMVWTTLGRGGSVQLSMLAPDLLLGAFIEVDTRNATSGPEFVRQTIAEFRRLGALARGESISVRCVLGFVGMQLIGEPLDTPWGVLRAPTEGEQRLRSSTPVANSQEVVLATEIPFRLAIDPFDASGMITREFPFTEELARTTTTLQRAADLLALSLLIGFDRDPPVAIARTWTLTESPMTQGPGLSWSQDAVPLHPHLLGARDRTRAVGAMRLVAQHYSDRIDIAVRRTLRSLTARTDPTDRLIDAIVALENLFGAGQGELSFRISASCARLLRRQAKPRSDLQKEIARLYTVRSKVVHGLHAPDPTTIASDATAASTLAVDSLRALFKEQPDLIDLKDRSRALILERR
jgi:hypothetical protein